MRKLLGYILLAISCVAWLAVPVIPFLPLSAVEKASWVGGVIIFAEIAWWLAMPLLGKEIIAWCKNAWQWCKRRLGFKLTPNSTVKPVIERVDVEMVDKTADKTAERTSY